MVMDYLKLINGMEVLRSLSMPIVRGSDVVVAATMVPMRGRSTSTSTMVIPDTISSFAPCFPSLERKRLNL